MRPSPSCKAIVSGCVVQRSEDHLDDSLRPLLVCEVAKAGRGSDTRMLYKTRDVVGV